jgi:hypothetical protein
VGPGGVNWLGGCRWGLTAPSIGQGCSRQGPIGSLTAQGSISRDVLAWMRCYGQRIVAWNRLPQSVKSVIPWELSGNLIQVTVRNETKKS